MRQISLIFGLILLAGFSRLIPHPWNFTAITAMAVFAGQKLENKKWAWIAPFLSLLWTDLFLGFHSTMIYVYVAALLPVFFPRQIKALPSLLAGSLFFFLFTNLGVWISQDMYTKSWAGLLECYAQALPFYENQILGDLSYAAVLFGFYALAQKLPYFKAVRA